VAAALDRFAALAKTMWMKAAAEGDDG